MNYQEETIKNKMLGNDILIFTSYGGIINPITFASYSKYSGKKLYLYKYDYKNKRWSLKGDILDVINIDDKKSLESSNIDGVNYFVTIEIIPEELLDNLDRFFYNKHNNENIDYNKKIFKYRIDNYLINKDFFDFIKFAKNNKEYIVIGVDLVNVKKGDIIKLTNYDGCESVEFFNKDEWFEIK